MIQDVLDDANTRMNKAIDALHNHLGSIRTGRAHPSLLDRIHVDYYGAPTPIQQLANINVPEPRMLVIQPYDKSSMGAIEKAILKSDLGITPNNDGVVIRLGLPPLTEERRKQLVKVVHQQTEDTKVAIRNVRRDAQTHLKDLLKEKLISEDQERSALQKVDDFTKKHTDEAEKVAKAKEHEVLEV
jgi:ribosome recycling factor